MQLIAAAERERRGLYGGAVGYLGYDGNLDTAITIRSAVLKDGLAHVHTGAGIVAGSVPEKEFEETEHKAAAMRRAIELAAAAVGATAPGAVRAAAPLRPDPVAAGSRRMILVIDNYDSFTFNLVQALAGGRAPTSASCATTRSRARASRRWRRTRRRTCAASSISPGPGQPGAAGVSIEAIRVAAAHDVPLLGVCLGMQSMAAAFGGAIVRAPTLVHGESSEVTHDGRGLLAGLPPRFDAARYHSLCVDPATLPPELIVTARSEVDGVVMGLRHTGRRMEGVQFHPESVLTPEGPHLLANFLRLAGEGEASRLDAAVGSFATRGMAETDAAIGADDGADAARRGDGRRRDRPAATAAPARVAGAAAMSDVVRAALATVVDGGTLSPGRGARRDGRRDGRRVDAVPAGRPARRAADARRDDRRAGRLRDRDARAGAPGRRARTARSTRAAPAATGAGRSTSRRRRHSWSRRPASRSRSTATAR